MNKQIVWVTIGCLNFYLLPKVETPLSLRDSSPISGAKWLAITFIYNEQANCRGDHQHFYYAKTNPVDLPINLSVQFGRPEGNYL